MSYQPTLKTVKAKMKRADGPLFASDEMQIVLDALTAAQEHTQRAVEAEREACAKVADLHRQDMGDASLQSLDKAVWIARNIRARAEGKG